MAPFPLSLPGHDFRSQRQNQVKAKEVNYALLKPCCSKELGFIQETFYLLLPNRNYFNQGKVLGVGNESTLYGLDLFPPSCHIWLVFLSKCRKNTTQSNLPLTVKKAYIIQSHARTPADSLLTKLLNISTGKVLPVFAGFLLYWWWSAAWLAWSAQFHSEPAGSALEAGPALSVLAGLLQPASSRGCSACRTGIRTKQGLNTGETATRYKDCNRQTAS